ncbi:NAD(P)/FAD-dependent oxidoreductase [Embleya sp. AB8]|uniref:NAD(P)/FAD-dependent oxidoreductase n=1 Tax=Embleya sp. AB8 TaxID=3156304 RepID=UPI003C74182B
MRRHGHSAEFPPAGEALELWQEAAVDGDFEPVNGGNLYFQTTDDELPTLQGPVDEARRTGATGVRLLDADRTREIIPCATSPLRGAMRSPADAVCRPEKGTAYHVRRARDAGAHVAYGVEATRLLEADGQFTGVTTAAGTTHAPTVVVAAGVWTPYLAKTVGLRVSIMPVIVSEPETEPVEPLFTQAVRALGFGARQRPRATESSSPPGSTPRLPTRSRRQT